MVTNIAADKASDKDSEIPTMESRSLRLTKRPKLKTVAVEG